MATNTNRARLSRPVHHRDNLQIYRDQSAAATCGRSGSRSASTGRRLILTVKTPHWCSSSSSRASIGRTARVGAVRCYPAAVLADVLVSHDRCLWPVFLIRRDIGAPPTPTEALLPDRPMQDVTEYVHEVRGIREVLDAVICIRTVGT